MLRTICFLSVLFTFALSNFSLANSRPKISVNVIDGKIIEEGQDTPGIVTVEVSLSSPSSDPVSVNLQTDDGQAKAGEDFEAVNTQINFAPGETTKLHQIYTLTDKKDEPYLEQFDVKLSSPTGADLGSATDIVTIKDDDEVIEIQKLSQVVEGHENETVEATFKISREHDSDDTVLVGVETKDGSASAGEDYSSDYTTIVLNPGELEKDFTVTVVGDNKLEINEEFYVEIWSSGDNVTISNSKGELYIIDDDGELTFSYELNVNLSGEGAAINAHTQGEIPLEDKYTDNSDRTIYEGRDLPFTHSSVWSRIGSIGTQPTVTSARLYAANNDFSPQNMTIEWEIGKQSHLRCSIPMQGWMNCVWWAGIMQYHRNTNWTFPSGTRGGYFTLKGFEARNIMTSNGVVVAEKKEVLNYSPQGQVNINEVGTYKLIRKKKNR